MICVKHVFSDIFSGYVKVLVGCINWPIMKTCEFSAQCFEKMISMICNLYEINEKVQSV